MVSVIVSLVLAGHCHRVPATHTAWHDELDHPSLWHALAIDNKAKIAASAPGTLTLFLAHVPADWPYQYQWSGVTRDATVDISRFPYLSCKVNKVVGYAHMDIDVLNAKGAAVKTLRSPTLTEPGISKIDLSQVLDPAIYHLQIRLILGGSNEGCQATYDWVRFTATEILNDAPQGGPHGALR